HAFSAALASECAAEQSAFQQFHDYVFEHRELIGQYPWVRIAQESGVPDEGRFHQCVLARRYSDRILQDKRTGRALGIRGTPALVINREVLHGAVEWEVLDGRVKRALKNESHR
ncbi:MAG: DsbA family protein, partial [Longimicrobiales bacterium]